MNNPNRAKTAEKALKEAVALAMEKYKKLGVNAAYSRGGKLYYRTPEGAEILAGELKP